MAWGWGELGGAGAGAVNRPWCWWRGSGHALKPSNRTRWAGDVFGVGVTFEQHRAGLRWGAVQLRTRMRK